MMIGTRYIYREREREREREELKVNAFLKFSYGFVIIYIVVFGLSQTS